MTPDLEDLFPHPFALAAVLAMFAILLLTTCRP
jgi:hypothetical protein